MSETTMIYRHVNYKNRAKCRKSLCHSLRIETNQNKKFEWNPELENNAWIFSNLDSPKPISEVKQDELKEYVNKILDSEFGSKKPSAKDKADLKRYEYKLNKKILTETKNGNSALVNELTFILKNAPDDYKKRIDVFENISRKNQLITMLDHYVKLSQKTANSNDDRVSKIHESFFKFPAKHGAVISPKQAAECISSFYESILPNHSIPLLVVHDDERTNDSSAGVHPHIFISTKDSVTGKRDLNKKLRNAVNDYLKSNPTTIKTWFNSLQSHEEITISKIPDSHNSYANSKIQGIILQDMFMQHVRCKFPDLKIIWTENRERKVKAFQEHYRDANQRKEDRIFNLDNKVKEQVKSNQLKNKNLISVFNSNKSKNNQLINVINKNKLELSNLNQEISQSESKLEYIIKKAKAVDAAAKISIEKFMKMYTTMLSCFFDNNIRTAKTASSCALDEFSNANKPARKSIVEIALEDQKRLENNVSNEAVEVHNNLIETMKNIDEDKSRPRPKF